MIVPDKRALHPEGLPHPRGVAASGFRPLRNIPHCCLPKESGPCLSPRLADHPLRPATRRRLGGPLPRQLADRPQTHLEANKSFSQPGRLRAATCGISSSFPLLSPTSRQVVYVLLNRSPLPSRAVRLAYLRHAASVRPEPGSNSPRDTLALPHHWAVGYGSKLLPPRWPALQRTRREKGPQCRS